MPNRQCFGQSGRDGRRSPYKRRAAAAAVSIRSPDVLETVSWLSMASDRVRGDAFASHKKKAPNGAFFICTENSFSTVQVVDVHKILTTLFVNARHFRSRLEMLP